MISFLTKTKPLSFLALLLYGIALQAYWLTIDAKYLLTIQEEGSQLLHFLLNTIQWLPGPSNITLYVISLISVSIQANIYSSILIQFRLISYNKRNIPVFFTCLLNGLLGMIAPHPAMPIILIGIAAIIYYSIQFKEADKLAVKIALFNIGFICTCIVLLHLALWPLILYPLAAIFFMQKGSIQHLIIQLYGIACPIIFLVTINLFTTPFQLLQLTIPFNKSIIENSIHLVKGINISWIAIGLFASLRFLSSAKTSIATKLLCRLGILITLLGTVYSIINSSYIVDILFVLAPILIIVYSILLHEIKKTLWLETLHITTIFGILFVYLY